MSKRLVELELEPNHSVKSNVLNYAVKDLFPILKNMQTYCLGCKKHADNIVSKNSNGK